MPSDRENISKVLVLRLFQFGSTSCMFHINGSDLLHNFVLPIDHFVDYDVPYEEIELILDTLDNIKHCSSIMTKE